MALVHRYTVGIISHTHLFDSVAGENLESNWYFQYSTKNANGTDATEYPGLPLQDKSLYPEGTIFFDCDSDIFTLTSSVKNVFIDRAPIVVANSDIHYKSIMQDYKCSIRFESQTPIDIKNLIIACGNPEDGGEELFKVIRKEEEIIASDWIYNVSVNKDGTMYDLSFDIDKTYSVDKLNENQLYVKVWNIAGNTCEFVSDGEWNLITTDYKISDLTALRIQFSEQHPENRIIYDPVEGSVKVEIINENPDFYSIKPKFELDKESIGRIDLNSIGFNPETGITSFYVNCIRDTGYVIVNAWLEIDNTELTGALYNATYVQGQDGEWVGATEGRLIYLSQNVPGCLKNDNYAAFTQMTEDFLNTLYTSLSNGKHISILEKIARVNNFENIQAIENTLIDTYKSEYNVTIDPNLEVFKKFLESKTVETTEYIITPGQNGNPDVVKEFISSNCIFQDITTTELYEFLKDIYQNIPYYNQLAGTYRGITFILYQLGLCVKLVEIWSDKNIKDNFNHDEIFVREDEINAIRSAIPDGTLADIGRYYLTSRFDVDVLESGLTFKEFNDLSFNIVKLILSVKPIHRVLRKLAYVFVANTNIHFQYFLLDKQNTQYGRTISGTNTIAQQIKRFNYAWNLFDKYAITKHEHYGSKANNSLIVNKLFVPFNAISATVEYPSLQNGEPLYNIFGEYAETNSSFIGGKYDKQLKPTNIPYADPLIMSASKNTYNNLYSIENKLDKSKLSKIKISFAYILKITYMNSYGYLRLNGETDLPKFSGENNLMSTFNKNDMSFKYTDETGTERTYLVSDYLLNKLPGDLALPDYESYWKTFTFTLGKNLTISSHRNGFYLNLLDAAQTIFGSDLNMAYAFNNSYTIPVPGNRSVYTPIALLCRIENIGIPLGTNYITQLDPIVHEQPPEENEDGHKDFTLMVDNPINTNPSSISWTTHIEE